MKSIVVRIGIGLAFVIALVAVMVSGALNA